MAPGSTLARPTSDPDHTLLDRVRDGDTAVFGVLYERHHAAVLRAAVAIAGPARAEDLVADAFARTLVLLSDGRGPRDDLRSYLVTAVRNGFFGVVRRESRTVVQDLGTLRPDLVEVAPGAAEEWSALAERTLVTAALGTLPDRWRAVLWLTAVEGRPLVDVGRILGISPHAVAQLAFRAREALRVAYLTEHVQVPESEDCRSVLPLLARRERGTVSDHRAARVAEHLDGCAACAAAGAEIGGLTRGLPTLGLRQSAHGTAPDAVART